VTDREAPFPLPRYSAAEAIDKTSAFLKRWNGRLNGRVRAWVMPFSAETCSADLLKALKRLADEHRTFLTLHFNSGVKARADYQEHGAGSPTAYLDSLGLLGPNVCLAHVLGIGGEVGLERCDDGREDAFDPLGVVHAG
jgi:cytosine/adenosine deaminase-related metal-dependent hydrolase